MQKLLVRRLVTAAMCLALALVLPFLTGQLPQIGQALCPMHIPVLLCGFLCGGGWGMAVGLIAPLLRLALFGTPPVLMAIPMTLELAVYGGLAGLLYRAFPAKTGYLYLSLLLSMIAGRLAGGLVKLLLLGLGFLDSFTLSAFVTAYITSGIPGILCQIVLIPAIVMALKKANP